MRLLVGKLVTSLENDPSVKQPGECVLSVSPSQVSLQSSIQFTLEVLVTRRQYHADRELISYYHCSVPHRQRNLPE